jgi:predicted MFS family arabinose efflux permease
MLLALISAFSLSQAYRTVAAIMGPPLQAEFGLSAQALGLFAAVFHFSFAALQLVMGIGVDLHGVRRTVLTWFPLTVAGSLLSALAPDFGWVLVGQALIGIGCSPAFLVCTVFISRRFPGDRFAAVSGLALAIGGVGMLATGSPLAWLIEAASWRAGFHALALLSALAWVAGWGWVREPAPAPGQARSQPTLADVLRGFAAILAMPHTWGIVALALVAYASFLTLRGLWLGPMLIERHGFSLVAAGHAAVAVTLASLLAPPVLGRLDPGDARRRRRILQLTALTVAGFGALALGLGPIGDVIASILLCGLLGYVVLLYADVRASYPPSMTGRALSLFTMAMFLGVALMQWITGLAASIAAELGLPAYAVVFASIGLLLALGALGFARLPQPPMLGAASRPAGD